MTPNDMNGGLAPFPEFHAVYIDPGSWVHYKKTGEFRDGTVLVKELISVGAKQATSGAGYFMGGGSRRIWEIDEVPAQVGSPPELKRSAPISR